MQDKSSLQLDEDVRLMIQVREGDRCAYEQVYQRYFRTIVSFLAQRAGHGQVCEDLAQEVFTRVWEYRSRYRPGRAVCPYLLGFAKNVCREHQTHLRRDTGVKPCEPEVDNSEAGPEAAAQRNDLGERVRWHLARLPPRQRQALELVYVAQMSVAEAARVMNCSTAALRQNLCQARQRLKKALTT